MKIEKITLYHIKNTLKMPFITSFGTIKDKETLIIKVESNNNTGRGEAALLKIPIYNNEYISGGKDVLTKFLIPQIINKEINKPEDVNNLLKNIKGHNISKAGLEMAIRDLFSKIEGVPLWEYIGGINQKIKTGISLGIQDKEQLIKTIRKNKNKRIKIKIKKNQDKGIIKYIRKKFPDIKLMVDANADYTIESAKELKEIDKYNLMMIEQPLATKEIYNNSLLKKHIQTPICLDESIETIEDLTLAIKIGAIDILNLKPARVGGITNSLKILEICKRNKIPVRIGGMLETGIGKEINYHIASREEVTLPGDTTPPNELFKTDIINENRNLKNKYLTLTEEIGLGITINETELEKRTIEKIIF